eukprot:jgi/Ulvmu1/7825/UM004_0054.1
MITVLFLTRLSIRTMTCSASRAAWTYRTHAGVSSTQSPPELIPGKLHCWYADHQEVVLPEGHRFPMHKYRATRQLLQKEAQMSGMAEFHPSPPVPMEDLLRVHASDYVHRFTSGQLLEQDMRIIGFPWTPSVVHRNLASVGGTFAATQAVLANPKLKMTAHISGGTHHAFAHAGEGFCVFNDIAVAASYAISVHGLGSVLVIDLDVHQGNGTAEIFQDDPRVTTFDMYCDSNYPWRTRRTNTYDVPLHDHISGTEYLDLLRTNLEIVKGHKPELIIFQAGVDALAEDALGNLKLTRNDLSLRNNIVYSFALDLSVPMVITMGGGYSRPSDASVDAHADVYRAAAFRVTAAD